MLSIKTTLVGLLLLALFAAGSFFVVNEGETALLLWLGKLESNRQTKTVDVYSPGVHFKLPLINTARVFDTRLQTMDVKTSRIVTVNKKDVIVDYYVKWRIEDLPLYFTRTSGNAVRAETLLEQKINDALRAEFGKRDIAEVVSDDRSEIMTSLQKNAILSAKSLGINVVDVRIKRIDLPEKVSNSIFERMRAEREKVANKHRAEGKAQAEVIRSGAERDAMIIVATAQRVAQEIRGDGEAMAAKIYAQAYRKDKDFFEFYRSLDAYQRIFTNHDWLVLTPDSLFFRYLNKPQTAAAVLKSS